jgi:hypothetical protein
VPVVYYRQSQPMVDVLNFYMDDSGTRRPDRKPGKRPKHGYDWFALGGVIVKEGQDERTARDLHADFLKAWNIETPLHSVEIRAQDESFSWLEGLPADERERFYEELYQLMREAPVVGLACVIDRPGYNQRYLEKYGRRSWSLCKTAFTVAVERAAKYALEQACKLRVLPERCNKAEDRLLPATTRNCAREGCHLRQTPLTSMARFPPNSYGRPRRKGIRRLRQADGGASHHRAAECA